LTFIDDENYIINLYDYYFSLSEEEEINKDKIFSELFINYSEDEFYYSKDDTNEDPRRENNRYDVLRDFVKNYIVSGKHNLNNNEDCYLNFNQRYRLDKAIINTVNTYKFDENHERNINYLIVFSRIEANFYNNVELLEEFTNMLYENEYSLILCFYYEEENFETETLKKKLSFFKTLISKYIVNGKIFYIKNFKAVKTILDSINYEKLDYLDSQKLNDFIDIIDID